MGNRKWPRGVRGWPCVHLAYVKFMSGLPRNYHCGNSGEGGEERLEREREREGGGGELRREYEGGAGREGKREREREKERRRRTCEGIRSREERDDKKVGD